MEKLKYFLYLHSRTILLPEAAKEEEKLMLYNWENYAQTDRRLEMYFAPQNCVKKTN